MDKVVTIFCDFWNNFHKNWWNTVEINLSTAIWILWAKNIAEICNLY